MLFSAKPRMITADQALPGRDEPILNLPLRHEVLDADIDARPDGSEELFIAMGCFWGAEQLYWRTPGVLTTAVGYQGGFTPNATYLEACSGRTGHAEAVRVVYDPEQVSTKQLLQIFFENHDPTQGLRQGNDVGSQYRSAIYPTTRDQQHLARRMREEFGESLAENGFGSITTEIEPDQPFYYAEVEHQQYLYKNPNGYCPVHATGVTCN